MALIQKLTDVTFTDTTIPKLYRDAVITDGTIFCYDFADPTSWVKQANALTADEVLNLVDGGAPGVTTALTFTAGKGFATGLGVADRIVLPDAAKLAGNTGGFLFVIWMKPGSQSNALGGQVAGYCYDATSGPWCIYWTNPNYKFFINGELENTLYITPNTAIKQMGIAWVDNGDGTFDNRIYIDGALHSSSVATYNTIQAPATAPTSATLGDGLNAGTLAPYHIGTMYRAFMDDLGVSGADPLTLIQRDWAANNGRFS